MPQNSKFLDVLKSSLATQLENSLQEKLAKEFEDFYNIINYQIEKRIGELEKQLR